MEFKPYTKTVDLEEIYQSNLTKFSFFHKQGDVVYQINPWVKCRDFLHDVIRAHITKKKTKIYGFQYDPATDYPIYLRRTHMAIRDSDKSVSEFDFKCNMSRALKILRYYERQRTTRLSKLTFVKTENYTVALFDSPAFWMWSPAILSIYTLLIRFSKYVKDSDDIYDALYKATFFNSSVENDFNYMRRSISYFIPIIVGHEKIFGTTKSASNFVPQYKETTTKISAFHNYAGILGLIGKKGVYTKNKLCTVYNTIYKTASPLVYVDLGEQLYYPTLYKNSVSLALIKKCNRGYKLLFSNVTFCVELLLKNFSSYVCCSAIQPHNISVYVMTAQPIDIPKTATAINKKLGLCNILERVRIQKAVLTEKKLTNYHAYVITTTKSNWYKDCIRLSFLLRTIRTIIRNQIVQGTSFYDTFKLSKENFAKAVSIVKELNAANVVRKFDVQKAFVGNKAGKGILSVVLDGEYPNSYMKKYLEVKK